MDLIVDNWLRNINKNKKPKKKEAAAFLKKSSTTERSSNTKQKRKSECGIWLLVVSAVSILLCRVVDFYVPCILGRRNAGGIVVGVGLVAVLADAHPQPAVADGVAVGDAAVAAVVAFGRQDVCVFRRRRND